jgi:protein-tyrosine kinase
MSKFFDQTLRARDATLPQDALKLVGVREFLESAASPDAPSLDPGVSRLEECRTLQMPLANYLHGQFKGSAALETAEESYRALRTRLLRLRSSQGLRSIVLTSAVPGEGKTITSLNLALCCTQLHDMRTLLIDADVRTHGLSRRLGCHPGRGLAEVLSGECEPKQVILATDVPGLHVLGSGSSAGAPAELFASRKWPEFIGWCNEEFKLVLIDSPPVLNLSDVELITAACDGVLIVVRAQYAKRDVLQKCASQIDAKKLLGVVYNAVENGAHQPYHYRAYLGNGNEAGE